jgi:hypothetical protein
VAVVNQQEQIAIDFVRSWAEKKGIRVEPTSRKGVGYDYQFIYPDGKIEKIEVKGTEKNLRIPDMSVREFDKNKTLRADFLLVVGKVLSEQKVLYRILRKAIKPENLFLKETYHIRRSQNRKCMGRYVVKT